MFKSLSPQSRFYCGLAVLMADGLFFLTAIFFILGGECWRFAPIFATPLPTDEMHRLFNAYAEAAAENDKSYAAQRNQDVTALGNIALNEPDSKDKQDKVLAVAILAARLEGSNREQAGANQFLRQSYHEKLVKEFDKKIAATAQGARTHERDGWLLSILASIVVLVLSWAIARAGIRLLRSAALPGTMFENVPQDVKPREEGRRTNG